MAYQAPYSGLAQVLAMQGRGPDTQLLHVTPMELRRLEAMAPNGRLPRNPETGLPEAGIFDSLGDIASIALPIAGSFLFPMAAPTLLGSTVLPAAVGAGLGSTAAGLVQGKGLGESLIQGGLSGLMSYGLGSLSSAFAPSGGVTATPVDPATASLGFEASGVQPFSSEIAKNVTPAATESTGFLGSLGEKLSTQIAPETLGGATYGSALGAGGSGLLAAGLLEEPYDVADVEMGEYDYYMPDLEAGRARGRAMARTPTGYYSPSELLQMATTRGYNPPFLAAEGGPVRLQTGGTATNPYGSPYGPGDPYGGIMEDSDQTAPSSDPQANLGTGIIGNFNITEPIDIGLGQLNPSPLSIGAGLLGAAFGIPGLGLAASFIGNPNVNALGQVQAYGYGNQSFDQYGNPRGTTAADMAAMSSVPATVGVNPGLQDPMGVYGGFTSSGQGIGAVSDTYGDEFGESTADMGSFSDGGGDSTGGNGGVGGDVGDDWSDIRLKRGVQYLGDVSGLRKYSWNYIWGGPRKVGVMAHELLGTKYADAVRVVDGYMRVDYSQLPAEVRTI